MTTFYTDATINSQLNLTRLKFKSNRIQLHPLPPPIISNVVGTWAYDTMNRRIYKDILPRIINDNSEELTSPSSPLRSECLLLLRDLESSLQCGSTGYLRGLTDSGPDVDQWNNILSSIPEDERNWIHAPWVIAEFYFYRRIIEAFQYFETGYDMFIRQKVDGLVDALPFIDDIAVNLIDLLDSYSDSNDSEELRSIIELALSTSLWGNKMDLSLWPSTTNAKKEKIQVNKDSEKVSLIDTVDSTNDIAQNDNNNNKDNQRAGTISYGSSIESIRSYILDDQTTNVVDLLQSLFTERNNVHNKDESNRNDDGNSNCDDNSINNQGNHCRLREIGIIIDNAGYEIVSDLLLGYCLVFIGVADQITFHTKGHPTFVSDATSSDILNTIDYLATSSSEATAAIGHRLHDYVNDGRFKIIDDLFWCQPTAFWDMPDRIYNRLSNSRLVIVKGDANYRRLLGDLQWPLDIDSSEVLSYWHVPCCALRTFKAEIGCGITVEAQQRAEKIDRNWQVSGKWGVVQLGGL